jgi:hypothetical protein
MNMATLVGVLIVVLLPLSLWAFITESYHKRPGAKRRAGELLRAVLTAEQYGQLIQQGYLDIPSPSDPERVYRVPRSPWQVQVREKGHVTKWLCLQPVERVPDADLVVIHKLMIEADEQTYLQKANSITPIAVSLSNDPV